MLLVLGLLFLVVPVVELVVIVRVASSIGVVETLGLLVLVSVAGAWLCKREGVGAWRRLQGAVERGELPHRQLLDGALIMFAGVLLLTPGFLSDILGIGLLVPPTRAGVRMLIERAIRNRSRLVRIVTVPGAPRTGPVVDVDESPPSHRRLERGR